MTDLRITQQTLDNCQVRLTVEVPEERVQKAMRQAAQRLQKKYRFPGFRPGKAPYHIVLQRLGRTALLEDVVEDLGQEVYKEALKNTELKPYDIGNLVEMSLEPLTYAFDIPLPPIVDPGDYRSLRVAEPPVDEAAIETHIQQHIDELRQEHTTWAPLERPIQYGDMVSIALKVRVDDEIVLDNDDWDFIPDEIEYTLAPSFDAAFIGMSVGETKSFTATFPDDSTWPGKEGQFEIEIKGVKGKELLEADDELAQAASYENYADMRQKLYEHSASHLREQAEGAYKDDVLDTWLAQAQATYAPATLDRMIDIIANEQEEFYKMYGIESLEELLRIQNKTQEEYEQELRPGAEQRLRRELLLDAVAEREGLVISDYERDQYLVEGAGSNARQLEEMRRALQANEIYRDWITTLALRRKAADLIIAIARGEEIPAPGEHPVVTAPPETTTEEAPAAELAAPELEASSQSDVPPAATLGEPTAE